MSHLRTINKDSIMWIVDRLVFNAFLSLNYEREYSAVLGDELRI
jgi:hypothetical protein